MQRGTLAIIGVLAFSIHAHAATLTIDSDGMAIADGKRTFILGIYGAPKGEGQLDVIAKAGFNLMTTGPDVAALDALHAHNMFGWINTGFSLDFSESKSDREAQLRKLVADYANHPALLVWELPDEALWNVWYSAQGWRGGAERAQLKDLIAALPDKALGEKLSKTLDESIAHFDRGEFAESEGLADSIWKDMGKTQPNPGLNISNAPERAAKMADGFREGYTLLRQIDTKHPVWANHAPRNSVAERAAFNDAADIVGCDIYPVPEYRTGHSDLIDHGLTAVGAYTRTMQEAAPGKPVWMVLQGFGWKDLSESAKDPKRDEQRRPTFDESRFMAYDAIVNGARGILYWGSAYIEADSDFWKDLQKLVRELADLQPVLSANDLPQPLEVTMGETWGSADQGVRILAKQTGAHPTIIAINESHDPLAYTIGHLEGVDGVVYSDKEAGVSATVAKGAMKFSIRGHGVQILRAAN